MQNQSNYNPRYYHYELEAPFFSRHDDYVQKWRTISDLHYHACVEVGLCTSGSGVFFVEDRVYSFSAGTVTYLPPGMVHIAQSAEESPSKWEFIFIDPSVVDEGLFPENEIVVINGSIRRLFNMMTDELREKEQSEDSVTVYRHLCSALAIKLCRRGHEHKSDVQFNRLMIMPAIRYISDHYMSSIGVEELAEQCNVSVSTLRRAFFRVTGQAPSEYIRSIRMIIAENLLRCTTKTVLEISEQCGFQTLSSFNRCFKQKNGISPSAFRRTV